MKPRHSPVRLLARLRDGWRRSASLRGGRCFALLVLVGWLASCVAPQAVSVPKGGVRIYQTNELVAIEFNGELFATYHYTNVPKPFLHPLIDLERRAVTRTYPLAGVATESRDHPHHRSFWFGHEPVNGVDFWTERAGSGRIEHRGFLDIGAGVTTGHLKTANVWLAADGREICADERSLRFMAPANGVILLDFEIRIIATREDVTFGDSKEGTFALRLADAFRVIVPASKDQLPQAGNGKIVLSTGEWDDGESALAARLAKREARTWGRRAAWCDYQTIVDGKTVGVAIMDHPTNPRHPTWWMVRDYGLFAANPFGRSYFEKGVERRAGDFKIPRGQSTTFRYRVVLHEGDENAARLTALYDEFAQMASPR